MACNHILTEEEVKEIKKLWAKSEYNQATLADKFGVHIMTINDILHHRTWKHLE